MISAGVCVLRAIGGDSLLKIAGKLVCDSRDGTLMKLTPIWQRISNYIEDTVSDLA